MPESAGQISIRIAALIGSERVLIATPGRHGDGILRELLTLGLKSESLNLTVLDADKRRLAAAASHCSARKISFVQARATRLPFRKHSFETILSFESLYSIRPPWTVLAELHRVLVPDGRLILLEPAKHGLFSTLRDKCTGPGKRIFPLEEIKHRLARGDFSIDQIEESAHVEGMSWPIYCVRAIKRENPVEPVPQFMTAREMMERRKKPPVGEELP